MMESEECAADGHPPKTGSAATRATPVEDQFVIFNQHGSEQNQRITGTENMHTYIAGAI